MQGKRLSALKRAQYSLCKQWQPRAYTDHILDAYPGLSAMHATDTKDRYLGHRISKERRRTPKKISRRNSKTPKSKTEKLINSHFI